MTPVLAAGLGLRHGRGPGGWALRSASFRLDSSLACPASVGIASTRTGAASAVVDLLAGLARPTYGELRVLGQDMTTARGRATARRHVGVARRGSKVQPAFRIRGLVEHAARAARLGGCDHRLLAAAILDRLSLTPWAEVPVRAVPDVIGRRARLAAGAVNEPALLLVDGLLDGLGPREAAAVADGIRDLGRDTAIVATGRDARTLELACDEIITMADGIIVRTDPAYA